MVYYDIPAFSFFLFRSPAEIDFFITCSGYQYSSKVLAELSFKKINIYNMENPEEVRKIEISQEALNDLNTTRKWTMFLAILGFIGIGLMLVIGIFAGVFLSVFNTEQSSIGFPEWLVFVFILAFAVLYFIPVLFLFRFSKHSLNAVKTLDIKELNKALKNLKSYFVYIGILVIVLLSIYVVAFIVAGASVAFLKDLG